MVPGGAEGGRSQGGVNWSTGRGGVKGLAAGCGARGSPSQGGAGAWKTQVRSMQQSGVNKGGAEGLKGNRRQG